jgi:hypothetical protein
MGGSTSHMEEDDATFVQKLDQLFAKTTGNSDQSQSTLHMDKFMGGSELRYKGYKRELQHAIDDELIQRAGARLRLAFDNTPAPNSDSDIDMHSNVALSESSFASNVSKIHAMHGGSIPLKHHFTADSHNSQLALSNSVKMLDSDLSIKQMGGKNALMDVLPVYSSAFYDDIGQSHRFN